MLDRFVFVMVHFGVKRNPWLYLFSKEGAIRSLHLRNIVLMFGAMHRFSRGKSMFYSMAFSTKNVDQTSLFPIFMESCRFPAKMNYTNMT